MSLRGRSQRSILSAKSRARILRSIRERFERDPESIASLFPEIYDELSTLPARKSLPIRRTGRSLSDLTEMERKAHEERLDELIMRSPAPGILKKNEGLEVIEHLIALGTSDVPMFRRAIAMAEGALGVSLSEEKNQTKIFRKGRAARIHNLLPGIQVYLTWDGKVLRIKWNMREVQWRNKALSFVGAGGSAITEAEEQPGQSSPGKIA